MDSICRDIVKIIPFAAVFRPCASGTRGWNPRRAASLPTGALGTLPWTCVFCAAVEVVWFTLPNRRENRRTQAEAGGTADSQEQPTTLRWARSQPVRWLLNCIR